MKKTLFVGILIIMGLIFPSIANCDVIWEKEFSAIQFVQPKATGRLFVSNEYYFILYFGMDPTTAEQVNGKWKGNIYPALMKIDNNGNTIYQNEKAIPAIDSLVKAGITLDDEVRGFETNDKDLLFDIPQTAGTHRTPNIYSFSSIDGNLLGIEGTKVADYQYMTTLKSIFADNEIFVLAAGLFTFNQSRIDVHSITEDEYGGTLKYRILLEMSSFLDSMPSETFANDFLIIDDHTFIISYSGKENKTIIVKYSYDKAAASQLSPGDVIIADLDWFTVYKPKANIGYSQFMKFDNGNLLVHSGYGSLTILNNNGEIIFNKKVFDDSYKNFTITNFTSLKHNAGYYAFWGYYIENSERNFAVIITDSDWNVVDTIQWDYNGKSNILTDLKEKENGNLIVFGNSLYKDSTASGISNNYIPYYAELRPNYVSVNEQIGTEQIQISPNPTNDNIQISNIINGTKIEIYNLLGTKQFETIYDGKINVSNLPVGVYYIKVGNQTMMFVRSN